MKSNKITRSKGEIENVMTLQWPFHVFGVKYFEYRKDKATEQT